MQRSLVLTSCNQRALTERAPPKTAEGSLIKWKCSAKMTELFQFIEFSLLLSKAKKLEYSCVVQCIEGKQNFLKYSSTWDFLFQLTLWFVLFFLFFQLDDWVLCRIYKKNIPLPMTSTMNREQEDHSFEDQSVATFPNITNQSAFELPKSSSFSDLLAFTDFSVLSRLLADNPSDSVGSEPGPFYTNANLNQPMVSSSSSYLHQKLPQQEFSALSSENQLKRQRPMALSSDEVVLHHTSKKFNNNSCNFTNITNQLDTPQYNLLNQSFFNQQILLNSQLEF